MSQSSAIDLSDFERTMQLSGLQYTLPRGSTYVPEESGTLTLADISNSPRINPRMAEIVML